MKQAPLIFLEFDKNSRIENLVEDYAAYPKELLLEAIERIQKRLGGLHLKIALEALENNDFALVAETCLMYYDKSYLHNLSKRESATMQVIQVEEFELKKISAALLQKANEHYGK
ncbi:MAG: hypothetical protein NT150_07755 [Bacteroidetes bacterium]|nr:hypothetical protein [Bacteroidota bacterium]